MTLFGYQFEHFWLVFVALGVIPMYLFATFVSRKRFQIPYPPIQYKSGSIIPKLFFVSKLILESVLILVLFLSLAKPYKSSELTSIEADGIDILLTVDLSSSMQATDFNPNRLEVTKDIIQDFVRRSTGHRLGLLIFAGHVFPITPMTTDPMVIHDLVEGFSLRSIDHVKSGGTAIGDAVLKSADLLKQNRIEGRDQVVILLSDGDNSQGMSIDLALKYALEQGIKFYTIGIGSTSLIHVQPDPKQPNWTFNSKLVEEPLQRIAKATTGKYYHAKNEEILHAVFDEISRLEQTPLEVEKIHQKKYYRQGLNFLAAILFLLSLILNVLFMRRPLK